MSGSGKTHWSKKLERKSFKRFCCDDLIEKKLSKELKVLGYSGIQDVAKWMGQPYDIQYEETSKKYLRVEKEAVKKILEVINNSKSLYDKNIVIDTTGSLIYIEKDILEKLSKITKVVYLEVPNYVKEEMYQTYLKDPKPVIWGDSFYKVRGESNMEALRERYSELLRFRSKRYERLADITLNYFALHSPKYTINDFLESVKK